MLLDYWKVYFRGKKTGKSSIYMKNLNVVAVRYKVL